MTQICLFTRTEAVKLEYSQTRLQTAPGPLWQNVLDFTAQKARRRKRTLQSEIKEQKKSLILSEIYSKQKHCHRDRDRNVKKLHLVCVSAETHTYLHTHK